MATTTATPWQAQIIEELDALTLDEQIDETHTHAAVVVPNDDDHSAMLLGTAESEIAAVVIAEDKGAQFEGDGEARVVKLDELYQWHREHVGADTTDGPTIEPRRQNVETEEGDELEAAPDEVEKTEEAPPEPKPGEQTAAFNSSDYEREDLQIPKIDGQSIDRISLKFSGEIFLDRSEPSDVKVYNALKLGKDVGLLIEAKCSSTAAKGATDRDGDLDVVVGTKGLKVHSISKPAGADWVDKA